MSKKILPTLEEIKALRKPLYNINRTYRENLKGIDKFALWVTEKVGTVGFFLAMLIWTVLWVGWNLLAPVELRFDPYPAFVLWLIISNAIQILLMPLILLGQNLQGKYSGIRDEADFEINVKAEREIGTILAYLEHQQKVLERMEKKTKR
ncbi:MAG: DUF1003 domain-containing protein [Candidatus Moranbacteria bacterium]|nr:DUF1003 domain-containing protein [Candidatus Moranbacteria bacterium]